MSVRAAGHFELRGWHVLVMLVAFFGAVIAVDVGFAIRAYQTFPGEVAARPYEDGLAFNRTLSQRSQERALGWRARIETTMAGVGRTQLRVIVNDRAGQPVRGLRLTGELERPATEAGRVSLAFVETKPGVYDVTTSEAPGAWDLSLSGTDRAGQAFEAQRRLVWR